MAHPIWKGSISFGLVSLPVVLYRATYDRGVHFHQVHEPDSSPIVNRRMCAREEREVPWEEVVKGYQLEDGRWVLLTEEDLESATRKPSHTIDVEVFIGADEVDPIYYDRPYILAPGDESSARAYALLTDVLEDMGRVGLGRFVLRSRERLIAVRGREGMLTLTTMLFHDEIRPTEPIAREIEADKPASKQVRSAVSVIEELGVPFDPGRYHDEHRARLRRIVESKRSGRKPPAPAREQPERPPTPAADLAAALEHSLAEIRQGRGRSPARRRRGHH